MLYSVLQRGGAGVGGDARAAAGDGGRVRGGHLPAQRRHGRRGPRPRPPRAGGAGPRSRWVDAVNSNLVSTLASCAVLAALLLAILSLAAVARSRSRGARAHGEEQRAARPGCREATAGDLVHLTEVGDKN